MRDSLPTTFSRKKELSMAKAIKAEQYVLLPAGGLRAKGRGAGA